MQYDNNYIETETFKAIALGEEKRKLLLEGKPLDVKVSTKYRGKILIIGSASEQGWTRLFADLVRVERNENSYLWYFENVEEVFEFPCRKIGTSQFLFDVHYTKGVIETIPKKVFLNPKLCGMK